MQKKKPTHKEVTAARESEELIGLKIVLKTLKENGYKDDCKEVKEIKKLIEQYK
jgi:hypothetical protein